MKIDSITGVRLGHKPESELINFDVKAKLEEKERRSGVREITFVMFVGTKPSVVKFEVEGTATLTGKDAQIENMLEMDPETKIPFVLYRIYQQIFMAIYLLATILNAPYPPPDLLFSTSREVGGSGMASVPVAVEVAAATAEEDVDMVVSDGGKESGGGGEK